MTFLNKTDQSERLKTIRTKLKLSQQDMAGCLGYKPSYLSNIENANVPLTFLLIESLSNLFKQKTQQQLNLNWLLLGWGEMSIEETVQGKEINGIVNIANNIGTQTQNHLSATQVIQEKDILIAELRTEIKMLREFLSLKNAQV